MAASVTIVLHNRLLTAPMSPSPGELFGPYEIVERIGAGGMGEVYKAKDTRLGRFVALKCLSSKLQADTGVRTRFAREARSIAALQHKNVCTLYDVGPDYLVMELLAGKTLAGPLPENLVLEYAHQILDALHAAHSLGIVHRDLKPGNIYVTSDGIKLLDFGLAKLLDVLPGHTSTSTQTQTIEGEILGTLQYMAPEQLNGHADVRSDLFAFGCILYEMLSGKRAFTGDSKLAVISAILHGEPPPIQAPESLKRLMLSCLAKDPRQRPQTAAAAKLLLESPVRPQPSPLLPRRFRWFWPVAAAVLALVSYGAWVRFPKTGTPGNLYRILIHPVGGASIDADAHVAVSPDGRKIAYIANDESGSHIWIQSFDSAKPRKLAGSEGGRFPIWSPDSRSIAFQLKSAIMRTDIEGGDAVLIAQQEYLGGVWTSTNELILGATQGLFRVPITGGQPVQITTVDPSRGEQLHNFPSELPNGAILYRIRSTKAELSGIYGLDSAHPDQRRKILATGSTAIYDKGALIWAVGASLVAQRLDEEKMVLTGERITISDRVGTNSFGQLHAHAAGGSLVADTTSAAESQQLTWFDRTGKQLGPVSTPANIRWFRLSPDAGTVMASLAASNGASLWSAPIANKEWKRVTVLPDSSSHPVWNPTGHSLIFQSQTPSNLFLLNEADPQSAERVTSSANRQWPVDWSKDGKWVLYYETAPKTQRDLWILPVAAGGRPQPAQARPFLNSVSNEYMARFYPEPDPRFVLYLSNESGKEELYAESFPVPKAKVQLTTSGASYPEWSGSGNEIFFVAPDFTLMAVPVRVQNGQITASPAKRLFRIPISRATSNPYAAAPDGTRFLIPLTTGRATGPLEVVINWPAMFKN